MPVHLIYIDEVKYEPPTQRFYWLCGLAVPEEQVLSVEAALHALATDYFGSGVLDGKTEFHAGAIVHGKGQFSGHDLGRRVELFKAIADVIDHHPEVGRIQIRIDPARVWREDFQRIAFMFMVERVEQLMTTRDSLALLIADHDREFANQNVRSLSAFKEAGTEFEFGQEIAHVVDTVHHTHSHHSRLLQLADLYVYSICLCENEPDRPPKKDLVSYVRSLSNFVYPTKYKTWPADHG